LFDNATYDLYSDRTFRAIIYPKHHNGVSPLLDLQLGLISQVPLDWMHLVCLGVMKKLLLTWTVGKYKLSRRDSEELSKRMEKLRKSIPYDFARKPRLLKDLRHFKATEFRLFVLYTGPVVLKGILDPNKYQHFMLLHSAIYILQSRSANDKDWVNFAGKLLEQFVTEIDQLYCKELLTYNMHSLKHLHQDVLTFGTLDKFSAFMFENFMQKIKRLLRGKSHHLAQIVRRLVEIESCGIDPSQKCKREHFRSPNNCFLTTADEVCIIENYNDLDKNVIVRLFTKRKDCSFYSFKSSLVDIYICRQLGEVRNLHRNELKSKMILLPYKNIYKKKTF